MRATGWVAAAAMAATVACGAEEPVEQPTPVVGGSPFEYPLELWDREIEGETILLVHVTEAGAVDSVYVSQASAEPAFDSAAVAGARTLRFLPGRQGSRRIGAWVKLPVRFSRDDIRSDASAAPAGGELQASGGGD